MKSNINITPLRTWSLIPKKWESRPKTANYDTLPELEHYADGWRDVVTPELVEYQRLGPIFYDAVNDVVTYPVVDFTDEEIKQVIKSNAQAQKEEFTQVKLKSQIETQLQALTDDAEILENQQGYPLWDDFPNGYSFSLDQKLQDFEGLDLKIYKVIQAHNKQSDWEPINVPALFVKVLPPGAALIWEPGLQVTVDQEYEYQGTIYKVIQSHTTQIGWEPPNVPSLWTEVV